MTPFDAASALANIVGLLAAFAQSRSSGHDASHREFIEWLQEHRHTELVEKITRSVGLQEQIDELLKRNHDELLQKMQTVNDLLAALLSRVEGMGGLAMSSAEPLSEQAMFLLKQLAESESTEMIYFGSHDNLIFDYGEPASYIKGQERFIEDDLDTLVAMGLFAGGFTSGGDRSFRLTRAGLAYFQTAAKKLQG